MFLPCVRYDNFNPLAPEYQALTGETSDYSGGFVDEIPECNKLLDFVL
jgi:hypothetical protein